MERAMEIALSIALKRARKVGKNMESEDFTMFRSEFGRYAFEVLTNSPFTLSQVFNAKDFPNPVAALVFASQSGEYSPIEKYFFYDGENLVSSNDVEELKRKIEEFYIHWENHDRNLEDLY
jgi:hypothetical protein